jgi:hypothetical protein
MPRRRRSARTPKEAFSFQGLALGGFLDGGGTFPAF